MIFTEILDSESLRDLFYIILVIGNMINAVSDNIYIHTYSIAMALMYRGADQVVHMASLLIHWITLRILEPINLE